MATSEAESPTEGDFDRVYSEPLRSACIRLLQLDLPPRADCNIQPTGRITVHELEQCPPSLPLSYALNERHAVPDGAKNCKWLVRLNGQIMSVTANLFLALRHLGSRQRDISARYFWVDALCIDQSSVSERTSQVAIMHQIYRAAHAVDIWLGPDLDAEAYFVRESFRALLQQFYHDPEGTGRAYQKYAYSFIDDDKKNFVSAGLPEMESDPWMKLVRFWDLSWFSRIWVLQEVALAHRIAFWCGNVKFSQNELIECGIFFNRSGLSTVLMILR